MWWLIYWSYKILIFFVFLSFCLSIHRCSLYQDRRAYKKLLGYHNLVCFANLSGIKCGIWKSTIDRRYIIFPARNLHLYPCHSICEVLEWGSWEQGPRLSFALRSFLQIIPFSEIKDLQDTSHTIWQTLEILGGEALRSLSSWKLVYWGFNGSAMVCIIWFVQACESTSFVRTPLWNNQYNEIAKGF